MRAGEEHSVLDIVLRGFNEFVRPDFTEQGVAEFMRAVNEFVVEHLDGHHVTIAEENGRLVGMIDVRDGTHVSLFFVEPSVRGRGVGRALMTHAFDGYNGPVTVNSSRWAVPAYERLGFEVTGPEAEFLGIRSVPMVKRA
jgi:GNAT superfamily N-acetyltransferase